MLTQHGHSMNHTRGPSKRPSRYMSLQYSLSPHPLPVPFKTYQGEGTLPMCYKEYR
ncbi:hypothetical protein BDR03DRAFT_971881 [Suillus americanus]|nr:hypothetical protein BDR03DRAFT_971881 [Suillus americanus]